MKFPFMLCGRLDIHYSPLIIPLNWLAWPKFAFKVMKFAYKAMKNGGH
jgi:hypothetical protein